MDLFYFTLICTFVIGAGCVLYGAYQAYAESKQPEDAFPAALEDRLNALSLSVTDADQVMGELSDLSGSVLKEMDDKYQELLGLYRTMEENKDRGKDREATGEHKKGGKAANGRAGQAAPPRRAATEEDDKRSRVLALREAGRSADEIARALGIGRGEVALMLTLWEKDG